ncbi:hypothetical protein HKD37_03G007307 [Glycine soja]
MASKEWKAPSIPTQVKFDRSRFTSQEAWEGYTDIVVPRKILPERNVIIHRTKFDEFTEELEHRNWHKELTNFMDGSIDVAIIKEFYVNLYDPEDKPPKQVRVRGHLIKFDVDTLNAFLKTPVILEEGENFLVYSRFCRSKPEPQELAARLCIPGRGFESNTDGLPLKILRKNLTTLAQTWSILSFSNPVPTSHTFDITLNRARLGFPALIAAFCKARGVISNSLTLESLSPTINVAYVKKNYWNLDDLSITFKGSCKARGERFEAPPSSEFPPSSPPTPIPTVPSASTDRGPLDFIFTPQLLHSMLQSLHRGQPIIMQSLQGLGLPSIMSMDDFDVQVAWPGAQPSPSGGGGTSAAQEPVPAAAEGEDELTPLEPFYFDTYAHMAQEEGTSIYQIPEPSPAPIPDDAIPSAPASELEQPIPQDSPGAQVLDLNEHAQEQPQEKDI